LKTLPDYRFYRLTFIWASHSYGKPALDSEIMSVIVFDLIITYSNDGILPVINNMDI